MRKSGIIFCISGIIVISAWVGTWYFIPKWYNDNNFGAGTFGDMFGGINALFSGLAFVGLIYTILVQRQELQEQRKSIQMQTEELSLQRRAIEMQTEELRMQREETARSADQLESQRELLYFQLVVAHVNELIAIKNKKIGYLHFKIPSNGTEIYKDGLSAINELVKKNKAFDEKYIPILNEFMNSFFYILQYVIDVELKDELRGMVDKLIFTEVSESEVIVLYGMNQNNEHNLMLLNRFGLQKKIQSNTGTL